MNEILDEVEIQKKSKVFSWLALIASVISIGFIILTILYFLYYGNFSDEEFTPPPRTILLVPLSLMMVGTVCSVISFVKREPSSIMKRIAVFLNTLLLVLLVATVFA